MKKIVIIVLGFFWIGSALAQENTTISRNTMFLELGGNCGFYSINYERIISAKEGSFVTIRSGFSAPIIIDGGAGLQVPICINKIIGKKKFKLELGLGIDNQIAFNPDSKEEREKKYFLASTPVFPFRIFGNPIVGIRYLNKSNIIYRLNFTPCIMHNRYYKPSYEFFPWGGVSIGYNF